MQGPAFNANPDSIGLGWVENPQAIRRPVLLPLGVLRVRARGGARARGWTLRGSQSGWTEDPSTDRTAGTTPAAELVRVGSRGMAGC